MRTSAIAVVFVALLTPLSVEVAEAAGQTHPLTVTGRALDPQGKPIAGATIFIVSTYGDERFLGKTTSDAQGRYSFQDLPLPILVQKRVEIKGNGHFQIFGRAPGRAWAWCKAQQLCLDLSKKAERTSERRMFFPDEQIVIDLVFENPFPITGRVVDEHGRPMAGVKVTLSSWDQLVTDARKPRSFQELKWLERHARQLMPEDLVATSDATGCFAICSVPADKLCWLNIERDGYVNTGVPVVATAARPPAVDDNQYGRFQAATVPLEVRLRSTRKVPIRITWSDSGAPAAGLSCHAGELGTGPRYATGGTTDEDGIVLLRLPRGDFRLFVDPSRQSRYLLTEKTIHVEEQPAEQPAALEVKLGSVVLLKALDAETGGGIADVGFWRREEGSRVSERQRITRAESSYHTNQEGDLRAVVPPGTQRISLGLDLRPDYRAAEPEESAAGRRLELRAGETVTVEFKLVREPEDASQPPIAISGTVRIEGAVPAAKFIKPPAKFRNGEGERPPIPDESLLVGAETGGLANVVIILDKPPAGVAVPGFAKRRVEIAIAGGRFDARISLLRTGQPVVVANSDPEVTNVHVSPIRNTNALNQVLNVNGTLAWKYEKPEKFPIVMKSDLHPWMRAWLVVTNHPWVAVTDKTGAFSIRGLPAGKYVFRVWHEKGGVLDRNLVVEVQAGEVTQLTLAYPAERFKE